MFGFFFKSQIAYPLHDTPDMSTEHQEPAELSGTPLSHTPTPQEATEAQTHASEPDSVTTPSQTALETVPQGNPPSLAAAEAQDEASEHADSAPSTLDAEESQTHDEPSGNAGPQSEITLEGIAAKAARRRLNARDEALALELARSTLLTGRPGVLRVLALAGSLPWVVLVNASASAWSGLKPTARAQFLKGIGTVPGEGFVRTRMSIIRGLWKADAGAASKAVSMLFKDFVDKTTGLLPAREAIQFGNVFLGRGRPWIASADISSLKPAEQETVRLGIFSACVQTPQAPPVVIYAMRTLVDAQLVEKLTPQQLECGERAVAKMSAKWQRTLLEEVPGLPDAFRSRVPLRTDTAGSGSSSENASRRSDMMSDGEEGDVPANEPDTDSGSTSATVTDAGSAESRRERPVYVSKTIPSKSDTKPEERRPEERRTEDRDTRDTRELRDDRSRRGREPLPEPRRATGPFNPADALRQLDAYIQGLRVELNAAQVRLRQRDDDARRKRPERRTSSVPGDQSAEELYRQVRQLELRNAELQAQIEEFRASSEVRGVSRGLVDGLLPDDAAAELRRALSVTLRDDFEDFEALKRDAKDVVVQRYFGSLLQHIFEALRDEGVIFEGLTPGVETKEQIIESQAALKAVDIVPLVLDEPDDEDLEELDVLDAKAEDLDETLPDLDADEGDDQHDDAVDEEGETHADSPASSFGDAMEDASAEGSDLPFDEVVSDASVEERAFPEVSPDEQRDLFEGGSADETRADDAEHDVPVSDSQDPVTTDPVVTHQELEPTENVAEQAEPKSLVEVNEPVSDAVTASPPPKRSRASKSRTPESEA